MRGRRLRRLTDKGGAGPGGVTKIREHEQMAVRIKAKLPDAVRRQTVFGGEELELAVAQTDEALGGARPECAIGCGDQGANVRTRKRGVIDELKGEAIKADEADFSAEPEETVSRLGESLHGVLRQTMLHLPALMRITGGRRGGLKRRSRSHERQQEAGKSVQVEQSIATDTNPPGCGTDLGKALAGRPVSRVAEINSNRSVVAMVQGMSRYLLLRSGADQLVGSDRDVPHPFARRVIDRVHDGCRGARDSDLANPARADRIELVIRNVDSRDIDLSDIGVHRNVVVREVRFTARP